MLPSDTDPFTPADFVNTFTKLDGQPGIAPVANYAGLPKGLTSAQHGSQFLQMDNGAIWYWYQPVAGTAGVWKRSNSVGILGAASTTAVSTTATTDAAAVQVAALNTVAPGVRALRVTGYMGGITNSSVNGGSVLLLLHNGTTVAYFCSTDGGTAAHAGAIINYALTNPAAGSSHAWSLKMRTAGAGTSSTYATGQLTVAEA